MRAREFVTEKKIGTIQLKGLTIEIDDHIVDQALARQVHPKKVDIILRKLPGFKDKISKIPSGQKFWVYDSTVDAGLGFRCLSQEEGRYALKTTVSGRPWHSDTPIVDIKEDTHTVVVDMYEVGMTEISSVLEEKAELYESESSWAEIKSIINRLSGEQPQIGQSYAVLNLIIVPTGKFVLEQVQKDPMTLVKINTQGPYTQYEFELNGKIFKFPEDRRAGDQLSKTYLYARPDDLSRDLTFIELGLKDWEIRTRVVENFADGKKPGRKGLAKRVGVNCKQSVSKLRKIAKNSSGERQRMAHWCANMKSGKQK